MKKPFIIMFMAILFSIASLSTVASNSTCSVKFSFDGLGVVAFGDPARASVGVLDVAHHTPKIQISKVINGRSSTITTINAQELINKDISIAMPNKPSQPSRYITTNMNSDKKDFRWCLDLESDIFQKELYLKPNKLVTKINFSVGEFYTQQVTDEKYQFMAGSKIHNFNRQIGSPAAKVELHAQDTLTVRGLSENINLPYQSGVSYHIDITNLPPADMANMDHFAFYYDAFKTDVTRFMPIEAKKASFRPAPYLCDFIILGKSSIK